jgi:hypothetical protein
MHEEKYITHIHKGIASHRAANSRPERRYMNDLTGMTVWEFKDILEDMKKVYAYKDEETLFGLTYDPREEKGTSRVEICTKDQDTGIYITMRKAGHRSE